MSLAADNPRLPAEIRRALSRLRWRIRGYVWLHGMSLAAIWIGLTFWLALASDYLPVLAGASELPRGVRGVLLGCIAAVLAWVLYRWVLRRSFVPLADRSLAVLLERRFLHFRDSLITAVELARPAREASAWYRQMLAETQREAVRGLGRARPAHVLNYRPLVTSLAAAGLLLGSLGAFRALNATAFDVAVGRLYLLREEPWPRSTYLEVAGVEVQRASSAPISSAAPFLRFADRRLKVAKGWNIRLVVRADGARYVPEVCTVSYRTQEGDRGRVNMTRVGRIRDGYQTYKYDGKPFRGILSSVEFEVAGFDSRVPPHLVEAVDSPAVIDCQVDCVFPDYLVDERLSLWLPRTVPLTSGTRLPRGTQITLRLSASKDLKEAWIVDPDSKQSRRLQVGGQSGSRRAITDAAFRLDKNLNLEVTLVDSDNIPSDRPYRMHLGAVEDEPPAVDISLRGISSAVTPDVAIPARGRIRDDYGLARSWFEAAVNDGPVHSEPFAVGPEGRVEAQLDFREQRSREGGLALKAGDKLNLVVKAADKYNLGAGPNVGAGDHYQLEVVTPDRLLAMLEAREIGLRRRMEQIVGETAEMRDMLVRVQTEDPPAAGDEPASKPPPRGRAPAAAAEGAENGPATASSLRLLRAQQSLLQSQKLAQEVLGLAASFREIREELIANRVDTEDRKQRLQQRIAEPLERVGTQLFPELDRRLERLSAALGGNAGTVPGPPDAATRIAAAAQSAVRQANDLLAEMNKVLQEMLDLETYNELLDIVRSLIEDQERLMGETKKEQKKQVLDLLQ